MADVFPAALAVALVVDDAAVGALRSNEFAFAASLLGAGPPCAAAVVAEMSFCA
jgi:hypothetical protein